MHHPPHNKTRFIIIALISIFVMVILYILNQQFSDTTPQPPAQTATQSSPRDAGIPCKTNGDCPINSNLICEDATIGRKCVPIPEKRKIGTWCDFSDHCNTLKGFIEYGCDKDENMCVGASRNVSCDDNVVNTNPNLGQISVPLISRCDKDALSCNERTKVCEWDTKGNW